MIDYSSKSSIACHFFLVNNMGASIVVFQNKNHFLIFPHIINQNDISSLALDILKYY